jgi:predicted 2-oxoglutarate/Fe(II)-dependent dioxygenase YbiX
MYCKIENALSKEQVNKILAIIEEQPSGSVTHHKTPGQNISPGKRDQYSVKLDSIKQIKKHIYKLAEKAKSIIESKYNINIDILGGISQDETKSEYGIVSVYKKGESYDWHKDSYTRTKEGKILPSARTLTIVIQLSEEKDYENGDLRVKMEKDIITSSRKQGSALVFTPETLHGVTELTKGVRKSLIVWLYKK